LIFRILMQMMASSEKFVITVATYGYISITLKNSKSELFAVFLMLLEGLNNYYSRICIFPIIITFIILERQY